MTPDALTTIARAAPDTLGVVAEIVTAAKPTPEAVALRERRRRLRLLYRTRRHRRRAEAARCRQIARAASRLSAALRRDRASAWPLAAPLLALLDADEVEGMRAWVPAIPTSSTTIPTTPEP